MIIASKPLKISGLKSLLNYLFRSQLKDIICSVEKLLVTAINPFEQVIEKGSGPLLVKQGNHIKILVQPGTTN